MMKVPKRFVLLLLAMVGVSIVAIAALSAGWVIADRHSYKADHQFPLLDPSVNQNSVHQEILNFDPLRQNLKQYFTNLNLSHSLYFEYLPNGVNIRDGADDTATAASLMKTPIVMDLYRLSEEGRLDLNETATVQKKDISNDANYGDPTNLMPGDTLSFKQAAEITLKYSDNTTLAVIKDKIIPMLDDSTDSIQSLDISYNLIGNSPGTEQVTISSRSYASILKCLYYACFNTPQDSTQIIQYLTNSAESKRIVAGIPSGIRVAHKVGSSTSTTQSDCGIVYVPGRPYLICLMFFNIPSTETGIDSDFQTVSKMIYQYVASSGKTSD